MENRLRQMTQAILRNMRVFNVLNGIFGYAASIDYSCFIIKMKLLFRKVLNKEKFLYLRVKSKINGYEDKEYKGS